MTWEGTPIAGDVLTFVTLDELKRYVLDDPEDTDRDALMLDIALDAEAAIRQHVAKKLTIGRVSETREVWIDAGETVVRPDELVSIDSIVDGDGNAIDFRIERKVDGFVRKLRVSKRSGGELRIAGSWGYAAVPRVIRDATVKTVRVWFFRDVAHLTREVDANGNLGAAPRDLPDAVIELLELFEPAVGLT